MEVRQAQNLVRGPPLTAKKAAKTADAAEVTEKKTTNAAYRPLTAQLPPANPKGPQACRLRPSLLQSRQVHPRFVPRTFDEDDVGDLEADIEADLMPRKQKLKVVMRAAKTTQGQTAAHEGVARQRARADA